MALFSKKQNKTNAPAETKVAPVVTTAKGTSSKKHAGEILLSPRITEKGTIVAQQNCYVFNVARSANRRDIARAIEESFGVVPMHIRTTRVPGKTVTTRGTFKKGRKAEGKKAYVYLKKGDTIEIA